MNVNIRIKQNVESAREVLAQLIRYFGNAKLAAPGLDRVINSIQVLIDDSAQMGFDPLVTPSLTLGNRSVAIDRQTVALVNSLLEFHQCLVDTLKLKATFEANLSCSPIVKELKPKLKL